MRRSSLSQSQKSADGHIDYDLGYASNGWDTNGFEVPPTCGQAGESAASRKTDFRARNYRQGDNHDIWYGLCLAGDKYLHAGWRIHPLPECPAQPSGIKAFCLSFSKCIKRYNACSKQSFAKRTGCGQGIVACGGPPLLMEATIRLLD
jgi:hypothetical protein